MTLSAEQYLNSTEALPSEVEVQIEDIALIEQVVHGADESGTLVEAVVDPTSGYYYSATVEHTPSGEVTFILEEHERNLLLSNRAWQ